MDSRKIIWDIAARDNFHAAILFIKEQSFQNGEKVKKAIILATKKLVENPESHPLDKYRLNNDGNFRAFELYHFRISYYTTNTEIRIVRFRHTSRKPMQY